MKEQFISEEKSNNQEDIENKQSQETETDQQSSSIPLLGFLSIKYYRQYFDVTTELVLKKLFFALSIVFYKKFKQLNKTRIDFYGPFWIYVTIVFSLSVSQNLYSFLSQPEHSGFKYTIGYLPNAFMIVFLFGFGIPLMFNLIIRAFGGIIGFTKVVSIYGYSQSINIFILLLCAYPNSTYQNFLIIWGACHSSIFLFLCLKEELDQDIDNLRYIGITTMCVCQLCLVIIYKQFFFRDLYHIDQYYQIQQQFNINQQLQQDQLNQPKKFVIHSYHFLSDFLSVFVGFGLGISFMSLLSKSIQQAFDLKHFPRFQQQLTSQTIQEVVPFKQRQFLVCQFSLTQR